MFNLFLIADSGTGKSTAINKSLESFDCSVGGFQVKRCISKNNEIYYDMVALSNNKSGNIIATCHNKKPIANINVFEDIGVNILENSLKNSELIILDEIGFLEERAENFKHSIRKVLDSNKITLGVLKKFHSPFLNELRERNDILFLEITFKNRDYVPLKIVKTLKNWQETLKHI